MTTIGEHVSSKNAVSSRAKTEGSKPSRFSFPRLQRLNIVTAGEAEKAVREIASAVENLTAWLAESTTAIGESLGMLSDRFRLAAGGIDDFNAQVREAVNSFPTEPDRERVRAVVMRSMLANFPSPNSRANNLLADVGLAIGYLEQAREADRKRGHFAKLPVTGENGRWQSQDLTSRQKDAKKIIRELRNRNEAVQRERIVTEKKDARDLREGTTGSLADVLESGAGTATMRVPFHNNKRGQRVRPSTVKFEVKDGQIYTVDAVGGLDATVRRMVEDDIRIPVSSLNTERINLRKSPGRDRVGLMYALRDIVQLALKNAVRVAEGRKAVDALKTQVTPGLDPEAWSNGKPGKVLLYRKDWEMSELVEKDGKKERRTVETIRYFPLVVERAEEGIDSPVRIAICLPEHEKYCSPFREFTTPERGEDSKPYINLGWYGAYLRVVHDGFVAKQRRENARSSGDAVTEEMARLYGVNLGSNSSANEPPTPEGEESES